LNSSSSATKKSTQRFAKQQVLLKRYMEENIKDLKNKLREATDKLEMHETELSGIAAENDKVRAINNELKSSIRHMKSTFDVINSRKQMLEEYYKKNLAYTDQAKAEMQKEIQKVEKALKGEI